MDATFKCYPTIERKNGYIAPNAAVAPMITISISVDLPIFLFILFQLYILFIVPYIDTEGKWQNEKTFFLFPFLQTGFKKSIFSPDFATILFGDSQTFSDPLYTNEDHNRLRWLMKTKTSIIVIGLVTIAIIAAGTVLGVNLATEKPNKQTPSTHYLTIADKNTTVSMKKGDLLNLTLQDFGDGGYVWNLTQCDQNLLKKTEQFTWGSSGMLGDFGKDTWVFSAVNTGNTVLLLKCERPFGDHKVCQQFGVSITIV